MTDRFRAARDRIAVRSRGARWAWRGTLVASLTLGVGVAGARLLGRPALAYLLAVPSGILFGLAGAVGFVVGGLLAALWTGTASLPTVAHLAGDLVLVTVGFLGWAARPPLRPGGPPRAVLSGVFAYLRVATVALLASVGLTAVALEASGTVPVAAAVPVLLVGRGPAVLGGVVVLLLAGQVVDRPATVADPGSPRRCRAARWARGMAPVVLVLGWLVAASAASLLRQDLTSLPGARAEFAAMLPEAIAPMALAAMGPYYPPLQVGGCAVVLVALLGSLARSTGPRFRPLAR
jgi:hypothetical protein